MGDGRRRTAHDTGHQFITEETMRYTTTQLSDQVALFNSPAQLRVPAFIVIDALQKTKRQPGVQMLATAVALIAMCESANINFNDLIAKAIRVTSDVEGPFTSHLQAVRDYARHELLGGGR